MYSLMGNFFGLREKSIVKRPLLSWSRTKVLLPLGKTAGFGIPCSFRFRVRRCCSVDSRSLRFRSIHKKRVTDHVLKMVFGWTRSLKSSPAAAVSMATPTEYSLVDPVVSKQATPTPVASPDLMSLPAVTPPEPARNWQICPTV